MQRMKLAKVSLSLLLAWAAVAQAEVAGRVLVAVGDTAAVRGGAEIRLVAGTPIETGDLLRVGDASNLQVRFTDEAIMALRPNSTVRIDDYAFTNKADSDKSIFSLIKGGLRTITGIIGRSSRQNYSVKTETSTIGIRGTHFNLVQCAGDCRNPDGAVAPNGTFGGVSDGRIAVSNNAGEREFGKNEFFFVASRDALPAGLLAPPPFLRDRLEGQVKSKGKTKGSGEGSETAQTTNNTSTTTQPTVATPPLVVVTQPFKPGDQPAVSQTALVSWVAAGGDLNYTFAEGTGKFAQTISTADFNAEIAKRAAYQQGYSEVAGKVHWGVIPIAGSTGEHWAYGDPIGSLPSSGIATFTRIGGTTPTNNEGMAGTYDTINAAGSSTPITINFGAQTISGTIAYSVPAPTGAGGGNVAYAVTISGSISGNSGTTSAACNYGGGCSGATATSAGSGFANGVAMGVATKATVNSFAQTSATVQVYQK
jgi:hypothetical protein